MLSNSPDSATRKGTVHGALDLSLPTLTCCPVAGIDFTAYSYLWFLSLYFPQLTQWQVSTLPHHLCNHCSSGVSAPTPCSLPPPSAPLHAITQGLNSSGTADILG